MPIITASIDVTKLDKTKFKPVVRKDGTKAIFADLVLIETPNGQYGDYMVVQGVTKEERDAGVKGAILGNGKIHGAKPAPAPATQTTAVMKPGVAKPVNVDDDLAF